MKITSEYENSGYFFQGRALNFKSGSAQLSDKTLPTFQFPLQAKFLKKKVI